MNLEPRGFIPPAFTFPPLDDLAPLPKLTTVPARIPTPAMLFERDVDRPDRAIVDELMAKVRAEDERMRRILPAAPPGLRWEAEIQSQEPDYNFARNAADVVVRLAYRLRKIGE